MLYSLSMKKEFVFTIDPSGQKSLLIRIAEVEREDGKLKWKNRRKLYKDELLQGAAGSSLEAFKILLEEKMRKLRSLGRRESLETLDASEVEIESKRSIETLKILAGTGKLYFERVPIALNLFSNLKIRYFVCREKQGSTIQILAKLISPSQEFDIDECDFVFFSKPYWVIHKGCLKCINENVLGKWMTRAFLESPFKLTSKDALEFYEEVGKENIEGDCSFSIPDPLPVLVLSDPRGGFANLFMNYEGTLISFEDPEVRGRNKQAEIHWKRDLMEAGYMEKKVGNSLFYCPMDKVEDTLHLLLQIGWVVKSPDGRRLISQTKLNMNASETKDSIEFQGTLDFNDLQAPLPTVVNALMRNERFIALNEGTAGLLSKDLLQKNSNALFEGEILVDRIVVKKQDTAGLQELFSNEASFMNISGIKEFRQALTHLDDLPLVTLPPRFLGKLRHYQEKGVSWLSFLSGQGLHGILADDMGLGKTVQLLAFLSTLTLSKPVLIVMPKSLLFHWKGEIERFLPSLSSIIYHGAQRNPLDLQKEEACAILTTYSTLRQDIDLFEEISFSAAILDEAQAIKNKDAQTAQAVRKLTADFRLSITGTPIENHIGELLSQFQFLMPGFFEKNEAAIDLPRIKKKARPFILRRKKGEVEVELPEKIEQSVWLEMESSQKALYDGFLNGIREGLLKKKSVDGGKASRMEIFEAILRLRQICCHPLLFQGGAEMGLPSVKLEALLFDLESVAAQGQKALIFSQFTTMLKLIKTRVDEKGWGFCYLDGETKNREEVVRKFQENPEKKFFLISLKAGGVGMNLTAADYVFLYDPWWNKAVEDQAIDRAHRIGRRHPVIAKRFLIRDSIEERMMQLKESKAAKALDLFEEGAGVFNEEDLEYLLG